MPSIPKISLSRNQIIIISAALILVVGVFVLVKFFGSKAPPGVPVTLTVWGVDSPDAFKETLSGYKTLRPNVTVNYAQVPEVGYNDAVLKALASGKGPDIFVIGNHDVIGRGSLLSPAPATQISLPNIETAFPQAVIQDFVLGGSVYALPLYMDTLALVYNKQLFDQAGIATPPETWQEVLDIVPKLRVLDASGRIDRAAIALGGSENSVAHAVDILNLLMLQNGVNMAADNGKPSFSNSPGSSQALRFYMQFADAASPAYTWNDSMGRSMDSFAAQRTAMILAYKKDLADIEKQAPFLDLGVSPAPQISADYSVNYPSYRGLATWVGSKSKAWAWDFILFASTNSAAQNGYLSATGRAAALRQLIAVQQRDPKLSAFAKASLTARSWKVGDYDRMRMIFSGAIQNVQSGAKTIDAALKDAEAQINQLLPR